MYYSYIWADVKFSTKWIVSKSTALLKGLKKMLLRSNTPKP